MSHCGPSDAGSDLDIDLFPFDTTRSLELALFRTFAVGKGTPLLASTGEFTKRTQKRYDDTYLILSEMMENG